MLDESNSPTSPVVPTPDNSSSANVTVPKKTINEIIKILLVVALVMVIGGLIGWVLM